MSDNSESQSNKQSDKSITKHDFYFEIPLYEITKESSLNENIFEGEVDAYSALNAIDTTYTITRVGISDYTSSNLYHSGLFVIMLTCKRRSNDKLYYVIFRGTLGNDSVAYMKVGQLPSLADLQFAEIGKKYDKFLSREDLQEFKRAIGLAAHGVGAGSFVYLRRVFEKLIFGTFEKYSSELSMKKTDFIKKHMEEKIEVLKNHLPSQLLAMKSVYGILSKGVHELTEQECLEYFNILKLSIELILEQQIENEIKEQRDKEVKRQIQEITKKIQHS